METDKGWQQQLLGVLGLPATKANIGFFSDWERAEGGGATHNPFNTTEPASGATSYNSVGVKNYPDEQTGLAATAKTLQQGYYTQIIAALKNSDPTAAAAAVEASPWGTHDLTLSASTKKAGGSSGGGGIVSDVTSAVGGAVGKVTGAVSGAATTAIDGAAGAVASGVESVLSSIEHPLFIFSLKALILGGSTALIVKGAFSLAGTTPTAVASKGVQTAAVVAA